MGLSCRPGLAHCSPVACEAGDSLGLRPTGLLESCMGGSPWPPPPVNFPEPSSHPHAPRGQDPPGGSARPWNRRSSLA